MEQILQQHVLNVVQQMEEQVDNELHAMGKLQGDDYEALRQQRLQVPSHPPPHLCMQRACPTYLTKASRRIAIEIALAFIGLVRSHISAIPVPGILTSWNSTRNMGVSFALGGYCVVA